GGGGRGGGRGRWVRPILTTSAQAGALVWGALGRACTAGISRCLTPRAAAAFMAVGNESFDDCDMLTWSLGWTGLWPPSGWPAICAQRLLITSLTFMLNWVPLPVIQTWSGNWSWCCPARISSQTRTIRSFWVAPSRPALWLTRAAAFLTMA